MKHDDFAALELHAFKSAWRALARRWGLSHQELTALLPAGGEQATNPPRDTEARMRILVEIGYRTCVPEAMLREWLRTPFATLGWLTPLEKMSGSIADLRGVRRLVEMGVAS